MNKIMLVERHSGIIFTLAQKYYWHLPIHVRAGYDLEDMVSDLTLHLLKRQKQFRKRRGASSTFVWHLLERHCWSMLKQQTFAKRATPEVLSFDAQQPGETSEIPVEYLVRMDNGRRLRESRKAVETMIRFASNELREALSDLLTMQRYNYQRYLADPFSSEKAQTVSEHDYCKKVQQQQLQRRMQAEVQILAQRHKVTPDDFRIVLAGLV